MCPLLAWMSVLCPPPTPKDPRGQLRMYGHRCDHPDCIARGPQPGEALCLGHYTRPAWDRDEDPQMRPWPEAKS